MYSSHYKKHETIQLAIVFVPIIHNYRLMISDFPSL